MDIAISADGSRIAYESVGTGSVVILIGGAFNDRAALAGLAHALAAGGHRAIAYDRRGRGDSTDNAGRFDPAREIEDLTALIEAVGGRASLFGHSSGGVLAIAATLHDLPVTTLLVSEPPYAVDGARPIPASGVSARIEALAANDDRDGAATLFLQEQAAVPAQVVSEMRDSPAWAAMTALAHSLPYDLAVCGPDLALPDDLHDITIPTLAVSGDQTQPWLTVAAKAVATAVPGARHISIPGEDHTILRRPENLAPILTDFLRPNAH
ncbi:alpha/beta fold hydrolase [Actinomadura opuntiae]|uniref:alpha/beta fold hydrolase n=1 Tax=Actinomadura sp. OS1-43 TaxID=604315 RepID=UPI00255A926E|nr:alpha/beta hydrolase [Actinomadura sp. OS1-43]MDL4817297.1 alpha/beta hydrolase [Actinomadura sp. OS1-43]